MADSIVERIRALQTLAERKLTAEQREQRATKLADRTNVVRDWITSLARAEELRRVLAERTLPGVELVESSEPTAARQSLQKYRAAPAGEADGGNDRQVAWSALQRPLKALISRINETNATNVDLQKAAAISGLLSEDALGGLAAVPGLEARGKLLLQLRREIVDNKWKDLPPAALRQLLDKIHEFLEVAGTLINDDPTLSDEIRAFCALARSPAGAPVSKFTQQVRDWFAKSQHINRLRIHMK